MSFINLKLPETLIASVSALWLSLSVIAVIAIAALAVVTVIIIKKSKAMKTALAGMQNTYNELDNQAKLIVKTDLELHKTQSELDKKIIGLYTLHKISRTLITTLDEEAIFSKISREHLTELGFDKVIAFMLKDPDSGVTKENCSIKLNIGYDEFETTQLFCDDAIHALFKPVIQHNQVLASLDEKIQGASLEVILKTYAINSFVCAPISLKEGVLGALIVGSESVYSPITLGDKEVVSILAALVGQTLQNARLFEETWRSHQELEVKVKQRTKELSEALDEIKTVTKRKSDFVSAVAHELRTPLTSIKGYAALLSAGKLGEVSSGVKQRLEKINKHSDDLTSLINNILDISRIESGRQEMRIEPINIQEVMEALSDLLAPQLKERQLHFVRDIAEDSIEIFADKDQLKRVFINLIGNALKYTPAHGTITVRVRKKESEAQIDVADTGIGIAEKNLPKIFEEFYREDSEANQTIKGTGLGMSLVKYIVEAHKGKIWVESKLNCGTTFSFTLPLTKAAAQTDTDTQKTKHDTAHHNNASEDDTKNT